MSGELDYGVTLILTSRISRDVYANNLAKWLKELSNFTLAESCKSSSQSTYVNSVVLLPFHGLYSSISRKSVSG